MHGKDLAMGFVCLVSEDGRSKRIHGRHTMGIPTHDSTNKKRSTRSRKAEQEAKTKP